GEKAKIAIRNVRRDGMEALKEDEKKKEISEDGQKRGETEVQKLTDQYVTETDQLVAKKVQEILSQ
ncbi:MAG: ribosome recycling factor, partial [Erythrobacter sp.]|nr:ribosome recycling factor [Erythrobacter sp.]